MKKRFFLVGAIVALLVLVNLQLLYINDVGSDPVRHTGKAFIGRLWVDELNISAANFQFNYIGIAHVNASDDWVLWTGGAGDITANWSVNIQSLSHPNYCVEFAMVVNNINVNNNTHTNYTEIGNTSIMKTYNSGNRYNQHGSLILHVVFNSTYRQQHTEATMVCYLRASVKLNQTQEATNFTSFADDRAIVGLCFLSTGHYIPWSRFTKNANDNFPNMFSWQNGWNQSGRFSDENDMLNNQTYFEVGQSNYSQTQSNDPWYLGNITIYFTPTGGHRPNYDTNQINKTWKAENWIVNGTVRINYTITGTINNRTWVFFRFRLWQDDPGWPWIGAYFKLWTGNLNPSGHVGGYINVEDYNHDYSIPIGGFVWCVGWHLYPWVRFLGGYHYKIILDQNGTNSGGGNSNETLYWEQRCTYQNNSYNTGVTSSQYHGVTTVLANIYDLLTTGGSNKHIYSFKGDRGDTQIKFKCQQ